MESGEIMRSLRGLEASREGGLHGGGGKTERKSRLKGLMLQCIEGNGKAPAA